jgi:hypothetical protein
VLLNDSLQALVKEGKVEPEEAYLKAIHKDDMIRKLAEIGKPFARLREDGTPAPASPALARAGFS